MTLKEQVCDREIANQLRGLNVKQDGEFHWVESDFDGDGYAVVPKEHLKIYDNPSVASAFTVAELLELIPKIIPNPDDEVDSSYLHIFTDHCISWCVAHRGIGYENYSENSDDPNLANVLARMLVHLIEKGIVKL